MTDLAHPARADRRDDLVRPELRARRGWLVMEALSLRRP